MLAAMLCRLVVQLLWVTSLFVVEFLEYRAGQLFDYAAMISGIAITSSTVVFVAVSSSMEASER